ncbi:uncharacterized protein RBU57_009076 isoform 2-T3 [Macrochelys suwanniensis]
MTTFLLLMAGKAGPSWAAGRCSWLEAGEKMDPALSWEPRIPRSQVDFRAEKRSQENCFLFLPVNHSETRDQFAHTSPLSALHLILNLHCKIIPFTFEKRTRKYTCKKRLQFAFLSSFITC